MRMVPGVLKSIDVRLTIELKHFVQFFLVLNKVYLNLDFETKVVEIC